MKYIKKWVNKWNHAENRRGKWQPGGKTVETGWIESNAFQYLLNQVTFSMIFHAHGNAIWPPNCLPLKPNSARSFQWKNGRPNRSWKKKLLLWWWWGECFLLTAARPAIKPSDSPPIKLRCQSFKTRLDKRDHPTPGFPNVLCYKQHLPPIFSSNFLSLREFYFFSPRKGQNG